MDAEKEWRTRASREVERDRPAEPDSARKWRGVHPEARQTPEPGDGFDKQLILQQDREMIQSLTQPAQRDRPAVRKAPAIPKVKPHRPVSDLSIVQHQLSQGQDTAALCGATPEPDCEAVAPREKPPLQVESDLSSVPESKAALTSPTASTACTSRAAKPEAAAEELCEPAAPPQPPPVEPLVPAQGALFSSNDITRMLEQVQGGELKVSTEPTSAPKPAVPDPPSPVKKSQALQDKMREMELLMEKDMLQRKELDEAKQQGNVSEMLKPAISFGSQLEGAVTSEQVFRELEQAKECVLDGRPVSLAPLATKCKDLVPELRLPDLVRLLDLFTKCKCDDTDLYLRLLGEVPVQVRQATSAQLVSLCSNLLALRLREETYLDLFAMETINMVRAARRSVPKPPAAPRPGGPRPGQRPGQPPPAFEPARGATPGPFTALQLLEIGNAIAGLDGKPSARFVDTFQEELSLVVKELSREECELVSPVQFLTLFNDKLKRAFLCRCAEVGAGQDVPWELKQAEARVPDVQEYAKEQALRQQRLASIENLYVIELSVRKETFSFYSSLPPEVRTYLDGLHETAPKLPAPAPSALAAEVGGILDQLGVRFALGSRSAGLLCHVAAEGTNFSRDEVYYECVDASLCFLGTSDLTPAAKLRPRIFDRLGVKLTTVHASEWHRLSEAQKVNAVVKLHSYHCLQG